GKDVGAAVVIQDVVIKSYTDSGVLRNKGLKLRGLATVRAQIDFIIPVSKKSRTVTARINYRFRYKGDRTSAPSECCSSDDPAQNLAESQSFLSANARLPKVQQTPSGLQYRVIRKGTGGRPSATDAVTVNYRGMLPSGQVFDSNEGISFRLDGVIPGWTEGLQLMREGGYYRFYLPPELAYGERGTGAIKPNSALIFDVELVGTGGG
ncbi:MAG: putative peptidyl-prolyl cis-trans isomerase, FKBP-type, partial [Proteobacteria bacterium]|nr:putative peptidyl-prolyl cis-trans isomerase, FKBP-type [Pseudomonadota bacterium]